MLDEKGAGRAACLRAKLPDGPGLLLGLQRGGKHLRASDIVNVVLLSCQEGGEIRYELQLNLVWNRHFNQHCRYFLLKN